MRRRETGVNQADWGELGAQRLCPTSRKAAERLVTLAELDAGCSVLDPSAGTGVLLEAAARLTHGAILRTAIEVSENLCTVLRSALPGVPVYCRDFLKVAPGREPDEVAPHDRVIMVPPFGIAEDIKHVVHAMRFVAKDGLLVGVCRDGDAQRKRLMRYADHWERAPRELFSAGKVTIAAAVFRLRWERVDEILDSPRRGR